MISASCYTAVGAWPTSCFFIAFRKRPVLNTRGIVRYLSRTTLIALEHADVYRFGVKDPVFKDLTLDIDSNQRVVISGPVSSGKSTLAEVKVETLFNMLVYSDALA